MGSGILNSVKSTAPAERHRKHATTAWDWERYFSAAKEWIPDDAPGLNWFDQKRDPTGAEPEYDDQSPAWQPKEIPLGNGLTLVLDDS